MPRTSLPPAAAGGGLAHPRHRRFGATRRSASRPRPWLRRARAASSAPASSSLAAVGWRGGFARQPEPARACRFDRRGASARRHTPRRSRLCGGGALRLRRRRSARFGRSRSASDRPRRPARRLGRAAAAGASRLALRRARGRRRVRAFVLGGGLLGSFSATGPSRLGLLASSAPDAASSRPPRRTARPHRPPRRAPRRPPRRPRRRRRLRPRSSPSAASTSRADRDAPRARGATGVLSVLRLGFALLLFVFLLVDQILFLVARARRAARSAGARPAAGRRIRRSSGRPRGSRRSVPRPRLHSGSRPRRSPPSSC